MCIIGEEVRRMISPSIVAYRVFRRVNGRYFSLFQDPSTPRVVGVAYEAQPRRLTRENGFYAFRTRREAEEYRKRCILPNDLLIVRRVELFGKIVVHNLGYRAQYMIIKGRT